MILFLTSLKKTTVGSLFVWVGILFGLTAPGLSPSPVVAQSVTPSPQTEDDVAANPRESAVFSPSDHRFLLTTKGMILEGTPEKRGGSLFLRLPENKGNLIISPLDVVFIGPTRGSVFDFQRGQLKKGNPTEAVKLAEWSVHHQLASEGIAFLKETLAATDSTEGKAILQKQIDQMEYVERLKEEANRRMATNVQNEAAKSEDIEISWLAEFGRQVPLSIQEKFARRIQPLLLRRCAMADCHQEGTPETNFILRKTSRGESLKRDSLRNLEMIFGQIDFQQTAASRLLNHPAIEDQNGNRVYPFGNDSNTLKDYRLFTEWIDSIGIKMKDYRLEPSRPAADLADDFSNDNSDFPTETASDTVKNEAVTSETEATNSDSGLIDLSIGFNADEIAELDRQAKWGNEDAQNAGEKRILTPSGPDKAGQAKPTSPKAKYRRVDSNESGLISLPSGEKRESQSPMIRDEFDPTPFNQKFHPEKAGAVPTTTPNQEENGTDERVFEEENTTDENGDETAETAHAGETAEMSPDF